MQEEQEKGNINNATISSGINDSTTIQRQRNEERSSLVDS